MKTFRISNFSKNRMILSYYFIQEYVTLILCISYCIQYDIKKYEFFIEKFIRISWRERRRMLLHSAGNRIMINVNYWTENYIKSDGSFLQEHFFTKNIAFLNKEHCIWAIQILKYQSKFIFQRLDMVQWSTVISILECWQVYWFCNPLS